MNRTARYTLVALTAILLLAPPAALHAADVPDRAAKPNIVFILADDIGYGDLGCYGATRVKTPHCDRLAREGIRFTDAHATASVCTPTRYAFITGQYAWRNPAGVRHPQRRGPAGHRPRQTDHALGPQAGRLRAPGWSANGTSASASGDLDFNRKSSRVRWNWASITPSSSPPPATACRASSSRTTASSASTRAIRSASATRTRSATSPPAARTSGTAEDEAEPRPRQHDHQRHRPHRLDERRPDGPLDGRVDGRHAHEEGRRLHRAEQGPAVLPLLRHARHPRAPRARHAPIAARAGAASAATSIEEFDGTRRRGAGHARTAEAGRQHAGDRQQRQRRRHGRRLRGRRRRQRPRPPLQRPLRGYKGSLWEGGHREPFIARWPGHIKPGARPANSSAWWTCWPPSPPWRASRCPPMAARTASTCCPRCWAANRRATISSSRATALTARPSASAPGNTSPANRAPHRAAGGGIYGTSPEHPALQPRRRSRRRKQPAEKQSGKAKEFQALLDKIKADGRSAP